MFVFQKRLVALLPQCMYAFRVLCCCEHGVRSRVLLMCLFHVTSQVTQPSLLSLGQGVENPSVHSRGPLSWGPSIGGTESTDSELATSRVGLLGSHIGSSHRARPPYSFPSAIRDVLPTMSYGKKDEDADTSLVKIDRTQVFQEGEPASRRFCKRRRRRRQQHQQQQLITILVRSFSSSL